MSSSWLNIGGFEFIIGFKKRFDRFIIVYRKLNLFGNLYLVFLFKLFESLGLKEKSGKFLLIFMDIWWISWFIVFLICFILFNFGSILMIGELSILWSVLFWLFFIMKFFNGILLIFFCLKILNLFFRGK